MRLLITEFTVLTPFIVDGFLAHRRYHGSITGFIYNDHPK